MIYGPAQNVTLHLLLIMYSFPFIEDVITSCITHTMIIVGNIRTELNV